jgi:hypothetical protein
MEIKMKKEEFRYTKAWKTKMLLECSYPVIMLLGILAIGIIVAGSGGVAELKWWVPLVFIGSIVWAIIEIRNYRKASTFLVELSEETIRVGDKQASWEEISKIESRAAAGNSTAVILHTNSGVILNIPAATEGLPYIKGFIENHVKCTGRL